jgi:nitrile hydratase accessory protein
VTEQPGPGEDLVGPAALPRSNGELVFEAPWQRRIFGLTIAACRSGSCDWEAFRQRLIHRIGADVPENVPYWQHWTSALEDVLAHTAVLDRADIDARRHELICRPSGFDHRHE